MKGYKLTLRRRHEDGQLDEITFKVERDCVGGGCGCTELDEKEIGLMLIDLEYQTNSGAALSTRAPVRAWVDETGE